MIKKKRLSYKATIQYRRSPWIMLLSLVCFGGVPVANAAIVTSSGTIAPPQRPTTIEAPWPQADIPPLLGWTPMRATMCGGTYVEPAIVRDYPNPPPIGEGQVTITATKPVLFSQTGTSILEGNVTITQIGRQITADKAYIYRDPNTGKVSGIDLIGNVHYREKGKLIVSRTAHIDTVNRVVTLKNAVYRFSKTSREDMLNAWGTIGQGVRQDNGILDLSNATYSTCPPTTRTWAITAGKLHLDKNTGRGVARNSTLRIQNMPILYAPYLSFPIDNRRKTGFLFPTFGYANDDGFSIATPFYFNLAPNYDATLTPRYIQNRGLLTGLNFNYLTPYDFGKLNASIIPDDRKFSSFQNSAPTVYADMANADSYLSRITSASDTRNAFSFQDNSVYNQHWSSKVNLNYVSDDYYFQDFASAPQQIIADQLVNQADLNYQGENWRFLGRLQGYQTLHPINEALTQNQYSHLPQFDLNADYPNQPYGLEFLWNSQIVRFDQQNDFITRDPLVSGDRLRLVPGLRLPIANASGYFVPTLQLDETAYELQNQTLGNPDSINRTLPMFNIDSGLFFDRHIHFGNHAYTQTLEPRLFYLWVPVNNQNDIPLFDTNLPPFSYGQLFQTNRFVGYDRIGDADQLTGALTTRFLDSFTGEEKLRASVGEIFYLHAPQVCDTPDCINDPITGKHVSPIVSELSYNLNRQWNLTANWAWDPNYSDTDNSGITFNYHPNPHKIFYLGYNYIRNGDPINNSMNTTEDNLNRINLGMAYPVNSRWSLFGNWNYNISHSHPQAYFYGAEYNTCCWAIRFLASRSLLAEDQLGAPSYQTTYYVQIQLKGLGNIGNSDPSTILNGGVPGYHDTFG